MEWRNRTASLIAAGVSFGLYVDTWIEYLEYSAQNAQYTLLQSVKTPVSILQTFSVQMTNTEIAVATLAATATITGLLAYAFDQDGISDAITKFTYPVSSTARAIAQNKEFRSGLHFVAEMADPRTYAKVFREIYMEQRAAKLPDAEMSTLFSRTYDIIDRADWSPEEKEYSKLAVKRTAGAIILEADKMASKKSRGVTVEDILKAEKSLYGYWATKSMGGLWDIARGELLDAANTNLSDGLFRNGRPGLFRLKRNTAMQQDLQRAFRPMEKGTTKIKVG